MFRKILLAVDGSEAAQRATDVAIDLARLSHGEIVVFHVLERAANLYGAFELETAEEAAAITEPVVRRCKDEGVSARSEMAVAMHGRVAHEVMAQAAEEHSDVIVLGSRGLTDLSGLLVGSVAHRVLHLSSVPVLVVR
jgi:nucleotide-binding universal stress UspA family protein